jgi:hypothetical protein
VKILSDAGYFVIGYESSSALLTGAASNNQLRLHQGLHYLRSGVTRLQALQGFSEFTAMYPTMSERVNQNVYAVPNLESDLDASTIELILSGSQIPFSRLNKEDFPEILGVEALYECDERLINVSAAREFFSAAIGHLYSFNQKIGYERISQMLETGEFDFVVDATYFAISDFTPRATHEVTFMAEFDSTENNHRGGLTLIDGKLWSIYPTNSQNVFSLSHVKHSIMGQFDSQQEAETACAEFSASRSYQPNLEAMREHVLEYLPSLKDDLRGLRLRFLTRKLKPLGNSANREATAAEVEPGLILVQPGKIDAIFTAGREVMAIIEEVGGGR